MSDISNKLKEIINASKETEVEESINTRQKWKTGSYIFDVMSHIFGFGTLVLSGGAAIYTAYATHLSYSVVISTSMSTTCRALSFWCSKKFTDQATIVNNIIDSIKSGKMPTTPLVVDGDNKPSDVRISMTEEKKL